VTFAYAGFFFGQAVKLFIDDYHRYAMYVIGGALLIGAIIWMVITIRHRRSAKRHVAELAAVVVPDVEKLEKAKRQD